MKINSQNNFAEEKDKENNRKIIGKIIGRRHLFGRQLFLLLFNFCIRRPLIFLCRQLMKHSRRLYSWPKAPKIKRKRKRKSFVAFGKTQLAALYWRRILFSAVYLFCFGVYLFGRKYCRPREWKISRRLRFAAAGRRRRNKSSAIIICCLKNRRCSKNKMQRPYKMAEN